MWDWTFWFHADVTQKKNTDLRGKFCVTSVLFICVTSVRKKSSNVGLDILVSRRCYTEKEHRFTRNILCDIGAFHLRNICAKKVQ